MLGEPYNKRLFKKNTLRSFYHLSRFKWLGEKVKQYKPEVKTILELGCYDCRSLEYLPETFLYYEGYDSNWEGGLDMAIDKLKDDKRIKLFEIINANEFNREQSKFDITISLETLEHIHSNQIKEFINTICENTNDLIFVTVPNEKGFMLILKLLYKKIIDPKFKIEYSFSELFYAGIGYMKKVKRVECEHKGFDYTNLLQQFQNNFKVIEVKGLPFISLPICLNMTVAVVLRKIRVNN